MDDEQFDSIQVSQPSELSSIYHDQNDKNNEFYNEKLSFTPPQFSNFIYEAFLGEGGEGAKIIKVSMPAIYELLGFYALKFFKQNNNLECSQKERNLRTYKRERFLLSKLKEIKGDKYYSYFLDYKGETKKVN